MSSEMSMRILPVAARGKRPLSTGKPAANASDEGYGSRPQNGRSGAHEDEDRIEAELDWVVRRGDTRPSCIGLSGFSIGPTPGTVWRRVYPPTRSAMMWWSWRCLAGACRSGSR